MKTKEYSIPRVKFFSLVERRVLCTSPENESEGFIEDPTEPEIGGWD